MKQKKIVTEVKQMKKLQADFGLQVKQRLTKLQFSQQVDLLRAQELRESYHREQKAVRLRDDFLSIASHELKTSLTTIKALVQIIQRDCEKSQQASSTELLSKMDKQLNKTTKLINDLLDVSKIQSGKLTARQEIIDITMFLEEVVENCQRLANAHKIILKRGVHGGKMYVDRDQISQVMTNLITNAVKYSPGAKKVIVEAVKDKGKVVINVKDFGIGIIKERKEKIFERFFRAQTDVKDKTSGLGLGLYISKQLVKQNNGEIWVKSNVGEGSTFSISFPLATAEMSNQQFGHKKLLTR